MEEENKYHFAREIIFNLRSCHAITDKVYLHWIDKLIEDEKQAKNNESLHLVSSSLRIEDFHIGFEYLQYEMDSERYLNKGMIWKKKKYGFDSPRLHKIKELIDNGEIARCNES